MADRLPDKQAGFDVVRTLESPIIYFDVVSNQGVHMGVINVMLATAKFTLLADGQMRRDIIAVADLRFPVGAAQSLKQAIDNAVLLATPPLSTDAPENEEPKQTKQRKAN